MTGSRPEVMLIGAGPDMVRLIAGDHGCEVRWRGTIAKGNAAFAECFRVAFGADLERDLEALAAAHAVGVEVVASAVVQALDGLACAGVLTREWASVRHRIVRMAGRP